MLSSRPRYRSLLAIAFTTVVTLYSVACQKRAELQPPGAAQIDQELTIHGHTRIDPFYWLNDRDNPQVIEYLAAENRYTDARMAHTKSLQEKLFNEIIGRIKQTDESVPYFKNGYYYYVRYEDSLEYPIYCRKKGGMEADEEIMLNVNMMAEGRNYYQVVGLEVSPNNQLLAFGVDTVGRRNYSIRFKDIATARFYDDSIDSTTGSVAWANDNQTIFYVMKDSTLRPHKIFRHRLGKTATDDVEIYHEADNTFSTDVFRTKSGQYIMIASLQTLSSEYRYLRSDQPAGQFRVIQPRQRELEYSVDHFADHFYIRTNYRAKNFRLVKTPVTATTRQHWQDVVAHRDDVLLEDAEIFKNYLVIGERKEGLPHLRVFRWTDMSDHYIAFEESAYLAYFSTNPEFDTAILRYHYSSLTTPHSTYDYHMVTREKTLLKREEVVGDFDPAAYQSERLWATADDGTPIPVSLVYRKQFKSENMPCLLYGYGSYGMSTDPWFSSAGLSLLDRGFIYAIAHIRGGQEMGRDWYEDGKLLKKKNTFTDFINCAEFLITEKYTGPENLFALGGSAGGLLMGAVVNLRPELFRGIIASVPFVDVVTTMLDERIPLTTGEYDEWGNPNVKEYYEYILSYSPYDNVRAVDYPAMLVTTALHDSQVQYWEPAKWVAKLRAMKTGQNLLLLKTDMEAGHSGTTGRFKRHRDTALEYAFILDQLGIRN